MSHGRYTKRERRKFNIIATTICTYYDLEWERVIARTRGLPIESEARHMLMYFLRMKTAMSLLQITELINRKNHTTVISGVRLFIVKMKSDESIMAKVTEVDKLINRFLLADGSKPTMEHYLSTTDGRSDYNKEYSAWYNKNVINASEGQVKAREKLIRRVSEKRKKEITIITGRPKTDAEGGFTLTIIQDAPPEKLVRHVNAIINGAPFSL